MSTYSTNLALELIGTGEQSGTWGTTTNTNLGTLIEQAISGYTTYAATGGTDTLTIPNGASGTARNMFIEFTGTGGGTIVVPANKKLYFVYNNTSSAITVKVSGQTGVSVPAAAKMVLVSNGTDIVNAINYLATNAPLAVSSGGTGVASATAYAVQCGGTTSTGAHQSVASVGTSGQVLTSNGAGALPSFQTLVAFTSGMLMPYAGSSAPSGWLLCYGQAISRTTYADLFTAIGTTYGSGDGSTTFNIPDFRGRAAFGKDDMGGSAASRLTTAGSGVDGSTLGTGGGSQLTQQHTHTVTDPGHNHTYNTKSSTAIQSGSTVECWIGDYTATTGTATTGITNANYGSGSSQNVPPALVINYMIKT
jgi:microcystin-dependent protein